MAQTKNLDLHSQLVGKLRRREARICVVGLGYVGLPLALASAEAGHDVIGIDLLAYRVDQINSGASYVEDIASALVAKAVQQSRLRATTDLDAAADADVSVIAVPTPIDERRTPDLSYVRDAAAALAAAMRPGSLVILESTTYPGTTEEVVANAFRNEGFDPGIDIFIAYSPERIDPGNKRWNLRNTPKVVAGLTSGCLEAAMAYYCGFVENLVPVPDLQTAEITKLFENTFRLVNIGLVNEFQTICESFDINVWQVLEACASKPYGFMPFSPGPGIGGHCIPVDPSYLAWKAREKGASTDFIDVANRLNAQMPARILTRVAQTLDRRGITLKGSKISLLGVAYKKNSTDVRESPAISLLDLLHGAGAKVSYHDPLVPALEFGGQEIRSQPLTPAYLQRQDCAVVVTDHDAIDWAMVRRSASSYVDTRNALKT